MPAVVEITTARVVDTAANAATYTTASFTPTAGDLIVVEGLLTTTVVAIGATGSANGLTFGVHQALSDSGGDEVFYAVADQLVGASPVAMTITVTCTGDNSTGAAIVVYRVTGMSKAGATAILQQVLADNNLTAGSTPTATFAANITAGNPVIGMVANNTNPATLTQPTGFTEDLDTGYATPTTGAEFVHIDSHAGGTNVVAWGSTSTRGAVIAIELDASANGVTGTLATTLADATLAASGRETFTGTLASTLDDTTLAGSGTVATPVTGTLAVTLEDTTLAAAGDESFIGTLAATLDDTALAAAGTVANPVTGTLAVTLDDATLAGSGTVTSNDVTGTLAVTLDDATLVATGGETFTGTLAATLDDTTLAGSGVVGGAHGTLNVTLDDATLAAVGGEAFVGDLAVTLDDATVAVVGIVANPITGVFSVILDDATLASSGAETFQGTLVVTLEDATLSAAGVETIDGTLAATLDDTTLVAAGEITAGTVLIPEVVLTARVLPRGLTSPVHTRALVARVLPRRLETD